MSDLTCSFLLDILCRYSAMVSNSNIITNFTSQIGLNICYFTMVKVYREKMKNVCDYTSLTLLFFCICVFAYSWLYGFVFICVYITVIMCIMLMNKLFSINSKSINMAYCMIHVVTSDFDRCVMKIHSKLISLKYVESSSAT